MAEKIDVPFVIPVIAEGMELNLPDLLGRRWEIKKIDGEWVTFQRHYMDRRYDGTDSEAVVHLSVVKQKVLADAFEAHRERWREAKQDALGLIGWGITYPDDFWDDYEPPTLAESEAT